MRGGSGDCPYLGLVFCAGPSFVKSLGGEKKFLAECSLSVSTADRTEMVELVGFDGSLPPLSHRVLLGGVPSVWCVGSTCPGAFRAPEHNPPRKHLKAA